MDEAGEKTEAGKMDADFAQGRMAMEEVDLREVSVAMEIEQH